jgi:hypothetical protein
MDHPQSAELFAMAKKMIQLYLDERRKANVRKADFRRNPADQPSQQSENSIDTPVWLVQAMLLNVVYGHNCGDKRSGEIASTHTAALVSLAQGAELLRQAKTDGPEDADVKMGDDGNWSNGISGDGDDHAEWIRWKSTEERKRTLYAVFILSSLTVSAYNHTPALTNSEVFLDLPCDEEFYSAENSAAFHAKGGAAAANHNRVGFHDALGELLRSNEKQQKIAMNGTHGAFAPNGNMEKPELRPSAFGCLILINALHNYIWETRQRHHNKVWTNEETEKMHRHIEPALKAWETAWARNPQHSAERPNPSGLGPLAADAIPLLDLAYVRLFVNLSTSKDKFWQRDWDGMAEELARGSEIAQHAGHSPTSLGPDTTFMESTEVSGANPTFPDASLAQLPSVEFNGPSSGKAANSQHDSRSISRREKHLRKAALFAAEALSVSDKLGVTFADFTSRELPIQSAMCAFDCAQVLAEWMATLQDRVGRYLGIIGQDDVDPFQVPGIMLLEEDDAKLLGKIQEIVTSAEMKMSAEMASSNGSNGASIDTAKLTMDDRSCYAAKILRVTSYMLEKAAVWPMTRLMASCLEAHANYMRIRAERSVTAAA